MNLLRRAFARFRRHYFQALGYLPTSIGGQRFRVAPNRYQFWSDVAAGRWEPQTFEILKRFLSSSTVYYDVGAWVGPTVLFAASRCRDVVCFEPDPVAYRDLRHNIELNALNNVQSFSVALAGELGVRRMASFGHDLGDSRTSLLQTDIGHRGVSVLGVPWSVIADDPQLPKPSFIKVDIEGGEFELMPQLTGYLRKHRPVLYMSTHAPFLDAASRTDRMKCLLDAVACYDSCLDEKLAKVDAKEMVSDRSTSEFRSFVFM